MPPPNERIKSTGRATQQTRNHTRTTDTEGVQSLPGRCEMGTTPERRIRETRPKQNNRVASRHTHLSPCERLIPLEMTYQYIKVARRQSHPKESKIFSTRRSHETRYTLQARQHNDVHGRKDIGTHTDRNRSSQKGQ